MEITEYKINYGVRDKKDNNIVDTFVEECTGLLDRFENHYGKAKVHNYTIGMGEGDTLKGNSLEDLTKERDNITAVHRIYATFTTDDNKLDGYMSMRPNRPSKKGSVSTAIGTVLTGSGLYLKNKKTPGSGLLANGLLCVGSAFMGTGIGKAIMASQERDILIGLKPKKTIAKIKKDHLYENLKKAYEKE